MKQFPPKSRDFRLKINCRSPTLSVHAGNEWRASHNMRQINVTNQNEGPDICNTRRVPFTYCYSRHLLQKPEDWGVWVDVR